jgi:4-cresol dehydrogenase (hydroxylating)
MNQILEIDEELAYTVVEPGVRFFDLYEELRRRGSRLWPSIPDLGWGSIIGNTLDHGVGFTPLGDHPGRQCGMEVVLPDGDIMRTGMGAMTGNDAWAVRKLGYGPSADGMFMQSNLGIVTKMGCWLVPQPDCYMSCSVRVENEEDLAALIDTVRPLLLDGTIQNYPIAYNAVLVAGAFSGVGRDYWTDSEVALSDEVIHRMARETDTGWWYMRFALYGTEEMVDIRYRRCERAFAEIPDARVGGKKFRGDDVNRMTEEPRPPVPTGPAGALRTLEQQSDHTQAGIPTLDLLDNLSWDADGIGGHLDFSPVVPLIGRSALAQSQLLRSVCADHGFDYAASLMLTPRAAVNIVSLWFNTADEEQTRKAYDFNRELIKVGAAQGWGVYRTHLDHMDLVADQFDYNNHAMLRFSQTIKDALDPNGILSPGKQGIWPRRLRPDRSE